VNCAIVVNKDNLTGYEIMSDAMSVIDIHDFSDHFMGFFGNAGHEVLIEK